MSPTQASKKLGSRKTQLLLAQKASMSVCGTDINWIEVQCNNQIYHFTSKHAPRFSEA